jgi:hypothetical protein
MPAASHASAIVCALVVQAAFYLADLYDLRVASLDADRGRRLLGALGVVAAGALPAAWAASLDARWAVVGAVAGPPPVHAVPGIGLRKSRSRGGDGHGQHGDDQQHECEAHADSPPSRRRAARATRVRG